MFRVWTFAVLLAAGAIRAATPLDAPQVVFKEGASSSGWIKFKAYKASSIFFPARVNGRDVMVLLYGGPTNLDKRFADLVGLSQTPGGNRDAPTIGNVTVTVGSLTLSDLTVAAVDVPAHFAKITGQPVPLMLGEEAFNRMVVDIDYAHERLAFRDPANIRKPPLAVEVPLIELDGVRVVPLSINGAPPVQFELELGNVSGPLLVTPSYAKAHKLLEGHPTSQRLSGKFVEPVVTLDHLSFAGVDFPKAPIALVPDSALPPASITGGVGLPLLSHFHLIIDYPNNRLFAIPNSGVPKPSFIKDRLGLVAAREGDKLRVTFVAPASPAEAAGFKKDDMIATLNGKSVEAELDLNILTLRFADPGTRFRFTMRDGQVRQIQATDFF
jgi:PDZ domain